jgi:hypothetical protein
MRGLGLPARAVANLALSAYSLDLGCRPALTTRRARHTDEPPAASGGLPRTQDGQHAKRMLHDLSLALDETGLANFAFLLRLASNWPHFNRNINIDD